MFWAFPRFEIQYPALEDHYHEISKVMNIRRVAAESFFTDGRTDRQTDMTKLFSEYYQQDVSFLKFIYTCKNLYMFQTVFLSIIRSTKLLPPASLARLAAGSSIGLTNT